MSFQSCYAECAAIQYPSYFPSSGNIVPIFAYYTATQILNALQTNNNGFNTYCFMPGIFQLSQNLTDIGNGNIYLYGCKGSEFRPQYLGHYQLFYWRAASNLVVDNFYLNCLYINSSISFGLDFTGGNQNVTFKNNKFISMWEGDSTHAQVGSGFGLNGVHNVWILNNSFIATLMFGSTAFGCNYCNYTTVNYNTIINYTSGFQITAASNYGFNSTVKYNYFEANPPIQTGFPLGFAVGMSVFGTQLYTIMQYNTVIRAGYALDFAGNTPGYDNNIHGCITDPTNAAYNSRCAEFFACASCGPLIQYNTLIDYQDGIESGTPFTNFAYNTLIITSGFTGSYTPISIGCAPNSVYQFNNFTFVSPRIVPYQIATADGTGVTSYCCMSNGAASPPYYAFDVGQVIGLNTINNVNQWGFVDPFAQNHPTQGCCIQNGGPGTCNPQSNWNVSWNFDGQGNSNIHSSMLTMLHKEL